MKLFTSIQTSLQSKVYDPDFVFHTPVVSVNTTPVVVEGYYLADSDGYVLTDSDGYILTIEG